MLHMQMQAAYDEYNDHARSSGKSRGHFIVDLCRPGHLTICLRNFQERIKCNDDNWDAQFGNIISSFCISMYCKALVVIMQHAVTADAPAWHHIEATVGRVQGSFGPVQI